MTYIRDKDHVARKAEQQLKEAEKKELWRKEAEAVCGVDQ